MGGVLSNGNFPSRSLQRPTAKKNARRQGLLAQKPRVE